ncbi:Protein Star [Armadillidium vulgare]|nr:Protein Star [Armadillidium vulgare]
MEKLFPIPSFLKMWYGWEGVLIEGDPKNFRLMLQEKQKSLVSPSMFKHFCFIQLLVMFEQRFIIGKISNESIGSANHRRGLVEVQCLPLYSILLALNRTTIDYFSLDVEGHEVEVLETIPWDKVNITTLSVEYIHGKGGKEGVKSFMESKGYKVYAEVTFKGSLANDFIFYHPQLLGQSEIKS